MLRLTVEEGLKDLAELIRRTDDSTKGGWMMGAFLQDFRFAIRTLRKGLLVALFAIVSLALAIAGNATVFSMVSAFLFRPLPFHQPERMVILEEREADQQPTSSLTISFSSWADYDERSQTLSAVEAFRPAFFSLKGPERAIPLTGARVTPGFFDVLGVSPTRGRAFMDAEGVEGAPKVVVLTREYWQEALSEMADPLGAVLVLNGEPYEVVGILLEGFEFLVPNLDIWVPFAENPREAPRDRRDVISVGRLAPSATMEQVKAEITSIATQLEAEHPATYRGWVTDAYNMRTEIPNSQARVLFMMLQGTVVFVLLIACANIANLLLARGQDRRREIALRTLLGAGRMRIVRQLLTESFILVLVGGTLGLAMGAYGIQVIADSFASQLPTAWSPRLEPVVVAFTFGISVAAGLIFGILPAVQTLKRDQVSALNEGGGRGASSGAGRRLVSRGLVVAEIALSMVALGGGSVMVRGFLELQNADPGFEVANLLTVQFSVPESKFPTDEEKMIVLDEVIARASTLTGVRSVTLANALPQNVQAPTDTFRIAGAPIDAALPVPRTVSLRVDPGYLETMGVPLQQGRFLEETDRAGQPLVAVINRAMVDKRFAGRTPLGQLITLRGEAREIVGVVADVSQTIVMVSGGSSETVYVPIAQMPLLDPFLLLATTGDPSQLAGPTRTALAEVDPDLTVNQVQTMEQFVDQFFVGIRVFNSLLGGFGALALLLASLGTYGVLAYSVGQRRQEIGVRMALGAREGQITRMVVKQGLAMALIGLTIGTVLVVPLTVVIANLLEGLATVQPITVVAVGALLFTVTMMASVVPARRAAGVDPVEALRAE